MLLLRPKKDTKVSAKVLRKCSAYSLILLWWLDPDGQFAGMTYGWKISSKSLYLARFSRYKHFWGGYSAELKIFCRNRSISHGLRDISIFVFCNFLQKIRKFKMAAIFDETKVFWKLGWLLHRDTLWVKNFVKLLYLERFSRYKHFCVLQFLRKIRKFKMAAIFDETKFFGKLGWLLCRDTLCVKNFVKIALFSMVSKI